MFNALKKMLGKTAARGAAVAPALSASATPPEGEVAALKRLAGEHREHGRLDAAVQAYARALEMAPGDVGLRVNLAFVLSELGQLDAAREHLERALEIEPAHDDALFILGTVHRGQGDAGAAADAFRRTLAARSDFTICRLELCRLLFESGDLAQAHAVIDAGLAHEPGNADLHFYAGNLALPSGNLASACASYERAIAAQPEHDDARRALATALGGQGRLEDAIAQCRALRGPQPTDALLVSSLGQAFVPAGHPARAVEALRWATQLDPAAASVHHALAVALQISGELPAALAAYRAAIAIDPQQADFHSNLGTALQAQGKLDEAMAAYAKALQIDPRHPQALCSRAALALTRGEVEAAREGYEAALEVRPGMIEALQGLAGVWQTNGRLDRAAELLDAAVGLEPDHAGLRSQRAGVSHRQRRLDAALADYRRALALQPRDVAMLASLGNVLQDRGELAEALASYRAALDIDPTFAEGHCNLGTALQLLGKLPEAIAAYRNAITFKPGYAEAHSNLGTALNEMGKSSAADDSYRTAIRLDPRLPDAHNNLGTLLQGHGKLDEAEASYRKALSLRPESARAHGNLGAVLQEKGEHDPAIASYRDALALEPDFQDAQNNLLFTLNYHPDLSAQAIYAAYREYDERVGVPLRSTWREHANPRELGRRLKVGYVSPDFRHHSVRHFLEPLLAHHDKHAVEVYAYPELSREDAVTARYRTHVDHWVPTIGLSDEALAERIRADGIDMLVELAGHTSRNRLGAFARKPAPVSVSWLGFGYTSGLSAIDYLLTDAASAPEGSEDLFSERPWRIATPPYAYRPAERMGAVNVLPALASGQITFGTLTRSVRINYRSVRVWSQILLRVPCSRLVIDSGNYRDAGMRSSLLARFAAHGVEAERLQIGYHSPPWDVLRGMDIGLDCFPHNSGTTLFESLYMGVPFITLAGRPSVGRLGSSILHGVGHPEWIAHSEDEYVELAVALASGLPRLAALRSELRSEMQACALMDEPGFARKVEAAYREMFSRWVAATRAREPAAPASPPREDGRAAAPHAPTQA